MIKKIILKLKVFHIKITIKLIRTENRISISDLNTIPFADRDISIKAINNKKKIEIGILTQRGCPFPCSFCNANRFLSNDTSKGIVRNRTAKNIVDEMESLSILIKTNKTFLRFYDATFITKSKYNREWIESFCKELENRNTKVPFDAFIRSSSFDFSKENDLILLDRLKKVGLISTYIGLESGNDETLKLYNKKIVANESEIAVKYLRSIGIAGSTNGTMTFHQDISMNDIGETINFLLRLGLCSFWNCISRAETLPGIILETKCFPRRNCWDVMNYNFVNPQITKLYTILTNINEKYKSIRIEDRLIRELRDRIKLELFYNESSIDFNKIDKNLEADIYLLQQITNKFIQNLLLNINQNNEYIAEEDTIKFIYNFENKLNYINKEYSWIIKI